jgi:hypothetical protein
LPAVLIHFLAGLIEAPLRLIAAVDGLIAPALASKIFGVSGGWCQRPWQAGVETTVEETRKRGSGPMTALPSWGKALASPRGLLLRSHCSRVYEFG